ncbi:MAG: vitamin K epoxide reductase family protein [Candidatus Microsaccharimonas sp.]
MFKTIKESFTQTSEKKSLTASFSVLLAFAITALIAAFVLSVEKIHLLSNPDAVLSCSVNLVLNCTTVMQSWQSGVFFGIPNMYFGLISFPVLITVAVAYLWGGARFNKGFLRIMNIGILLGTIFAYWLFFTSLYSIQVLCPWCLVVTFSCTMMLAAATHIGLRENIWNLKKHTDEKVQKFLKSGFHQLLVASWLVLMVVLVFIKFGDALFL